MAGSCEPAVAPAMRFGRYEIVRRIGRGGMGDVFEARHRELGTRCAIKFIHPSVASDDAAIRRVLREGRAAGAIRHPHVISVFDVGAEGGAFYLVMELLEGEDLARRLARDAPLTVEQAIDVLLPVVSGVAAAHDKGIVHRDLKPSNVFLAQRCGAISPVVIDFGISKSLHRRVGLSTSSRVIAGTALYMAPEQLRGTLDVTGQSDQYSLGVLLYECVTGGAPFFSDDYYELLRAIMTDDVVAPSELNPDVPAAFDRVLLRAMARDPAARFPSVRALGAALLPFASAGASARFGAEFGVREDSSGGFALSAPPIDVSRSPAPPGPRWRARRLGVAGMALIPIPLLFGSLWMAFGGSARPIPAVVNRPAPATPALEFVPPAPRREAAQPIAGIAAAPGPIVSVHARPSRSPAAAGQAPPPSVHSPAGAQAGEAPVERGTKNVPIVE